MTPVIQLPESNFAEAAGLFALLSALWAKEANEKVLKSMTQPPLAAAWKKAGGQLPARIDPEWIESLSVDYCQLLIGPKNHASPFQSVWDQSRYQGDAAESMKKYVDMVEGFQPCLDMLDHVAVQLQFASALMSMAEQAKRKLIIGLAQAFARDHLEWTSPFFKRVREQAETPFYRSLADISHGFLFGQP